jgi:hypothetical protein
MSKYYLTEAYGELYSTRLTEASFYENLRFVDFLQQEEIEEVMEALIWEFMDYGDTLNEAVDTLGAVFENDEVLAESLDILAEQTAAGAARMAQRKSTRERQAADSAKTNVEKESNVRSFADRDARARRAARSAAVRGALSGAKRSVEGALSGVHKQIRDKKAQLKKGFSDTSEKAKAALSRVARGGRRVMNAVRGSVQGAKIGAQVGYNYPLKTSAERSPARERTQQRRDVAKATASDTFSRPKAKPVVVGSYPGRSKDKPVVVGTYPGRKAEPSPKAPVKSRSMVSAKSRARMDKNKEAYEKAKQKLNASVDYDLLTQYMIEDLIDEGYAETEAQAITILEDMSEENLNEFAAQYIQD